MKETLEIKSTKVGKIYLISLLDHGVEVSAMRCQLKRDVGWCCRELLRWYDKLGGISKLAQAARRRQSKSTGPVGKVFHGRYGGEEYERRKQSRANNASAVG